MHSSFFELALLIKDNGRYGHDDEFNFQACRNQLRFTLISSQIFRTRRAEIFSCWVAMHSRNYNANSRYQLTLPSWSTGEVKTGTKHALSIEVWLFVSFVTPFSYCWAVLSNLITVPAPLTQSHRWNLATRLCLPAKSRRLANESLNHHQRCGMKIKEKINKHRFSSLDINLIVLDV